MNYFVIPGVKISRPAGNQLTPQEVCEVVAGYYNVNTLVAIGKSRIRGHVIVRHLSMWILRKKTSLSLNGIGAYFKRDHTSVIHAVTAMGNLIEYDEKLQQDIKEIMRLL